MWRDLGFPLVNANPDHMTCQWQPDWLLPSARGVVMAVPASFPLGGGGTVIIYDLGDHLLNITKWSLFVSGLVPAREE